MSFDKPYHNFNNPYKKVGNDVSVVRTIYYGEVVSIEDTTDGGRIKVRITEFDKKIKDEDIVDSYPMLPKYFHIYPKKGEIVRVFIEDVRFPQRGRHWLGSVISQPHKIKFDSAFSALSTTDLATFAPDKAPSTYPDSFGVYPNKEDVGLIGRENADIILKPNQIMLRAGKHENGNPFKLNTKNPATILLSFDQKDKAQEYYSSGIVFADKIAFISHEGDPKTKAALITKEDRDRIFSESHPIPRGDLLVQALEIMRNALINHIHGYSGLAADPSALINLVNIDFDKLLQKNIVIN